MLVQKFQACQSMLSFAFNIESTTKLETNRVFLVASSKLPKHKI